LVPRLIFWENLELELRELAGLSWLLPSNSWGCAALKQIKDLLKMGTSAVTALAF